MVVFTVFESIFLKKWVVLVGNHLVENVKISFDPLLMTNPSLLKQVVRDGCAMNLAAAIKVYLNEFPEPRAIIILECFGISKRL